MDVPGEILIAIAAELNGNDLRSFRLAHSQFARAGISFLASRGISLLNTIECIEEFEWLLSYSEIATSVRDLTFFHGIWPSCPRSEWDTHPRLNAGNDRSVLGTARSKAFSDYSYFIEKENGRRRHEDVETMFRALHSMPNLSTVTIGHIQVFHWQPVCNYKYRKLQKKIWMTPSLIDGLEPAVEMFLLALGNNFSNITHLKVEGLFDPQDAHLNWNCARFPSIKRLHISSLVITQNKRTVHQFFAAFPNVVDMSISFRGWGASVPIIFGKTMWPKLTRLYLGDIWASERDIFDILSTHIGSLSNFTLSNALLTQGSWRSLFTSIRNLDSLIEVSAKGELYGRRCKDSITLDQLSEQSLRKFLGDHREPWPFN